LYLEYFYNATIIVGMSIEDKSCSSPFKKRENFGY